jgi:Helix-turn-helix domain
MSALSSSKPRLRTRAAAEYLGIAESTLEKWRVTGTGPAFERCGSRIVVYSVEALETFLAARRATSTSERPVAS